MSLLAGVEIDSLRQRFPGIEAIVRAMPNLPVAVRRGVTGLYTADADGEHQEGVNNLFAALGYAMWMTDEQKLAALGAVAGAGPAYVARFVAALAKAGVERGPHARDRSHPRARDRAGHGVDGVDRPREHGIGREPRRQPERHDRGGARRARP